jgi:hypothetical protein
MTVMSLDTWIEVAAARALPLLAGQRFATARHADACESESQQSKHSRLGHGADLQSALRERRYSFAAVRYAG